MKSTCCGSLSPLERDSATNYGGTNCLLRKENGLASIMGKGGSKDNTIHIEDSSFTGT